MAYNHTLPLGFTRNRHPDLPDPDSFLPPLLLSSGNRDGRVCIWDAGTGSHLASWKATLARGRVKPEARDDEAGLAVVGLAWVTARPRVLAILLASGSFTVWDTRGRSW